MRDDCKGKQKVETRRREEKWGIMNDQLKPQSRMTVFGG